MCHPVILFICSRESDYLQDLSFAGLSEVLGPSVLAEFPPHWQFHRRRKSFWTPRAAYPKNIGYRSEASLNWDRHSWESAARALERNEYRLVVLASAKPDALASMESVFEHIRVPWVFIDGGDRADVGGDFRRIGGDAAFETFQRLCARRKPALVFKRELALGDASNGLYPLPFSASALQVPLLDPKSDKKYDVAFWAVESSETRRAAFRLLKGRYDCDRNGSVSGQTFRNYSLKEGAYFAALNQTRISLSFRGEGFDTLRFWEVPMCGSLLLSESPVIQIPHPFSHGRNALFCKNDLSDLTELIDRYLPRPEEAAQIAAEGQAHLLKYHTHRRRAEYMLEVLESKLRLRFN